MKTTTAENKHRRGICIVPFCRRLSRPKRRMCCTCRSRKYEKNIRRLFRNLKAHAKARGKEFTITYEYFESLAIINGYDVNHGRSADRLSVDRIHAEIGYVVGNIQFLTTSENSKKSWFERTHGTSFTPPPNRKNHSRPRAAETLQPHTDAHSASLPR